MFFLRKAEIMKNNSYTTSCKTSNKMQAKFTLLIVALLVLFTISTTSFALAVAPDETNPDTQAAPDIQPAPEIQIATATQTTQENQTTAASDAPQVQEVYRLYNTITSEHLFTTGKGEYDTLKQEYDTQGAGWKGENLAWYSLTSSSAGVYRLYNPALGALTKMSHHYTTSKSEADELVANWGWVYDNNSAPIFYSAVDSANNTLDGATGVYRLYNDGLGAHHFTTSKTENDSLIANNGWRGEDIEFYAYENVKSDTTDANGMATLADPKNGNRLVNVHVEAALDNAPSEMAPLAGAEVEVYYYDKDLYIEAPYFSSDRYYGFFSITLTYADANKTPVANRLIYVRTHSGSLESLRGATDDSGVWGQFADVKFYSDNNLVSEQYVKLGECATKPADLVKDGYVFYGWTTSSSSSQELFDFSTPITQDTILYAAWKETPKNPVEVTYNSNGGSATESETLEKGGFAYVPNNPVKAGFTFAGWYKDEALTQPFNFYVDAVNESITLYAKWEDATSSENKTAFAVSSRNNDTISFYKRDTVPSIGDTFMGYTVSGVYTDIETVTSEPDWRNRYRNAVICDVISPLSTTRWFNNYNSVKGLDKLDMSNVKDTSYMFSNSKISYLQGMENWDMSNVENMSYMFEESEISSLDLSRWNTSKVTNMQSMFYNCNELETLDLSGWNTSSVIDFSSMFRECESLASASFVSDWNTSSAQNMSKMFLRVNKLTSTDIFSKWNTSNATNMSGIFDCAGKNSVARYNLDLSGLANWDVSKVKDMSSMFEYRIVSNSNSLSNWNTSSAESMSDLFHNANIDINALSNWNTSNVKDMSCLFLSSEITSLEAISNWDTSNVVNMRTMFCNCDFTSLEPIRNWNVSNVEDISRLFECCSKLTSVAPIASWDTSKVKDMNRMFWSCFKVDSFDDIKNWNTSSVTNMSEMFRNAKVKSINVLASWDTSNVEDMSEMFADCDALETVDLEGVDTSKVKDMNSMFYSCDKLKTIKGIENLDTSNVTSMNSMFNACTSLSANCSSWNVDKVLSHDFFSVLERNYYGTDDGSKEKNPNIIEPNWVS